MPEHRDSSRRLRQKERKVYTDEDVDEDEIEGQRTFSVEEKVKSTKYNHCLVNEMQGIDVNLKYFQENGFTQPLLIKDKKGLGLRVPSENFQVNDVKQCVGSRRQLDVMDVNTQQATEMTMKEWVNYYESEDRDRLLNVISLEFSHTRLENYVEQPTVVRQIDWAESVWPQHLKECQRDSTNALENMKYPKVQKYCLMSVAGCYTDFHIDMGGTSVWYHILHGAKDFWLIPPTEKNLQLYEQWTLSGKQGDVFFADQVEKCQRIHLEAGFTFFIPTGWIHAVHTPVDSLVFGGNFLHSFNIPMQLRIAEIEDKTKVPQKFRYPFFYEIHWYVLQRYVETLTGKQHRVKSAVEVEGEMEGKQLLRVKNEIDILSSGDEKKDEEDGEEEEPELDVEQEETQKSPVAEEHNYVNTAAPYKQSYFSKTLSITAPSSSDNGKRRSKSREDVRTPTPTRSVTDVYNESLGIVKTVSIKLEDVGDQCSRPSTPSSKPWIHLTSFELQGLKTMTKWLENLTPSKMNVPRDIPSPTDLLDDTKRLILDHACDDHQAACTGEPIMTWPHKKVKTKIKYTVPSGGQRSSNSKPSKPGSSSTVRRRRVRCKLCEPCTRQDCLECAHCKDMRKYGGPGRMKQTCSSRQCMAPLLPKAARCIICLSNEIVEVKDSELMECVYCYEIVHPSCLKEKQRDLKMEGVINEDLSNSWECPKCQLLSKNNFGLCRTAKARTPTIRHDAKEPQSHTKVLQLDDFDSIPMYIIFHFIISV